MASAIPTTRGCPKWPPPPLPSLLYQLLTFNWQREPGRDPLFLCFAGLRMKKGALVILVGAKEAEKWRGGMSKVSSRGLREGEEGSIRCQSPTPSGQSGPPSSLDLDPPTLAFIREAQRGIGDGIPAGPLPFTWGPGEARPTWRIGRSVAF